MSSTFTLKVATFTSSRTFNKTDAEVSQILKWFLADKIDPLSLEGLTQAQQNQFYLDAARDELVRYIMQEANRNNLREKRSVANLEEQSSAETSL
jgi:hypothetical protein